MLGEDAPDQAIARVRSRLESVGRAAAREEQDMDALGSRVAALEERTAGAAVRADLLARQADELEEATAALAAELAARSAELEAAVQAAETAQVSADQADEARHRTAARAEALDAPWPTCRAPAAESCSRDVDGVVGSLVDLVEIDEGWDTAFEAAIGAGVAAVVVDGRRSAQAALATLREGGVTGAILTPGRRPPGSGSSPPAAVPNRSGVTCGCARGARRPNRCSTPWSGAPCGSTAGRRPSTSPSPATTSSW